MSGVATQKKAFQTRPLGGCGATRPAMDSHSTGVTKDGYVAANPLDKLHRSWKGIYWAKGTHHRPLGELPPQLRGLHSSVRERYLRKRDYRPKELVAFLKKHPQPGWPA